MCYKSHSKKEIENIIFVILYFCYFVVLLTNKSLRKSVTLFTMCGIVAIFGGTGLNEEKLRNLALSCSRLLRHRGPGKMCSVLPPALSDLF